MSQRGGRGRRPGTPGPPVRSVRPFKSSEQYLEAMKEDLAEWLRDLYGLDISAANFLQVLETGLVLCRHANVVTEAALAFLAAAPARACRLPVPRAGVSCNGAAQPGTFQARDNVSNFIQWCRKEMGIQGTHPSPPFPRPVPCWAPASPLRPRLHRRSKARVLLPDLPWASSSLFSLQLHPPIGNPQYRKVLTE